MDRPLILSENIFNQFEICAQKRASDIISKWKLYLFRIFFGLLYTSGPSVNEVQWKILSPNSSSK